jgi:hypothetical protein
MKIVKWAAVAVTGLFVLMNLGAVLEPDVDTPFRVFGAVLGLAGAAAAVGLGTSQSWGRAAVIGVGVLNVIGSVVALLADQQGAGIGIVVGGLGAVLGLLAGPESKRTVVV